MYKVIWDEETGVVLLPKEIPAQAKEVSPPRPVFFEELDLLPLVFFLIEQHPDICDFIMSYFSNRR